MSVHPTQGGSGPEASDAYELTRGAAVRSSSWLVLRFAIVAVLGLVGSTLLIREVGPATWAAYSVAYFLIVFIEQAFGSGLLGGVVRAPELSPRLLQAGAFLGQGGGLVVGGLLALLAVPLGDLYGDSQLTTCLVAVGVCTYVSGVRSLPTALLERRLDYRWIAASEILDNVTFLAVALPLTLADPSAESLAVALAVRNVPGAVLVHWRARSPLVGRPYRVEMRELVGFGVTASGATAFFLLNGLVPVVVLGGTHATELAFFLTTATIAGYAATTQYVVQRIGFPSLSLLRDDPAGLRATVRRLAQTTDFLLVAALMPLAGSSPLWLPALLGDAWEDAGEVMAVIAAGMLFNGIIGVATAALYAAGAPRAVLALQLGMTAAYLPLAIVLVGAGELLLGVPIAYAVTRVGGCAYVAARLQAHGLAIDAVRQLALLLAASCVTIGTALAADGDPAPAMAVLAAATAGWVVWHRRDAAWLLRMLVRRGGPAPGTA